MSDKAKLIRDRILFGLLILGILLGGYHFYYKPMLIAKENAEAQNRQNVTAYEDQLTKKADSIQTIASKVGRLNEDLSRAQQREGYWRGVSSDLRLEIEDLKNSGAGVSSSGEDSVGTFYKVDFEGSQGIVSYRGYTKYYSSSNSFHYLNAWFDSIMVNSELFQDMDDVWKIKTTSLTPGVKLLSTSTIDSSIYIGLREAARDQVKHNLDILPPLGLALTLGASWDFDEEKMYPELGITGFYKIYYIRWDPLFGQIGGGIEYTLDIGNVVESIF